MARKKIAPGSGKVQGSQIGPEGESLAVKVGVSDW